MIICSNLEEVVAFDLHSTLPDRHNAVGVEQLFHVYPRQAGSPANLGLEGRIPLGFQIENA
jgi:hypothetical protein